MRIFRGGGDVCELVATGQVPMRGKSQGASIKAVLLHSTSDHAEQRYP